MADQSDAQNSDQQQEDPDAPDDGKQLSKEKIVERDVALPGQTMDPTLAASFAKELVTEFFDCLKSVQSPPNKDEDTQLFFPEGISRVKVRLKAAGGTAPAVDVEFTVSSAQG